MYAVTHSTVALPAAAFTKRVDKLARECAARAVSPLPAGATPEDTVAAVSTFLQRDCGFRVPDTGRSALPKDAILDHRAHLLCMSARPSQGAVLFVLVLTAPSRARACTLCVYLTYNAAGL